MTFIDTPVFEDKEGNLYSIYVPSTGDAVHVRMLDEDVGSGPEHEYAAGAMPTISTLSGAELDEVEVGETLIATSGTWTRDGEPYTPAMAEVQITWRLLASDGGLVILGSGNQVVVPAEADLGQIYVAFTLSPPDGDPVEAQSETTGQIVTPGEPVETPAPTPTAGQITIPDSHWEPDNQGTNFLADIIVAPALSGQAGFVMEWSTDSEDPPRDTRAEAMVYTGSGNQWEMSFTNPEAEPYRFFTASDPRLTGRLKFRYRITGRTWSAWTGAFTVPLPSEAPNIPEPEPISQEVVRYLFTGQQTWNSNRRGTFGQPVQKMQGVALGPPYVDGDGQTQAINFAVFEDVGQAWTSKGYGPDGRLRITPAVNKGVEARCSVGGCFDPDDGLKGFQLITPQRGGGGYGVYRSEDRFDTNELVLSARIPGGGEGAYGNQFRFCHEIIKHHRADHNRVLLAVPYHTQNSGGGGFYRSDSRGLAGTWTQPGSRAHSQAWGTRVRWVESDPRNQNVIWIATSNGLFRSNTGGAALANGNSGFTKVGGLPNVEISSVEINPADPKHMRVAAWANGVWECANADANPNSWTRVYNWQWTARVDSCEDDFRYYIVTGLNNYAGVSGGQDSRLIGPGTNRAINMLPRANGFPAGDVADWHKQIRAKGGTAANKECVTGFKFPSPSLAIGTSNCAVWELDVPSASADWSSGYCGLACQGGYNPISWMEGDPSYVCAGVFDYMFYVSEGFGGRHWQKRTTGINLGGEGLAQAGCFDPRKNGRMLVLTGSYGAQTFTTSTNYGQSFTGDKGGGYQQYGFCDWNTTDRTYCYTDKRFSRNSGDSFQLYGNVDSSFPGSATDDGKAIGMCRANGNVIWAISPNHRQIWRNQYKGERGPGNTPGWQLWMDLGTYLSFDRYYPKGFGVNHLDPQSFFYFKNGTVRKVTGQNTEISLGGPGPTDLPTNILHHPQDDNIVYLFFARDGHSNLYGRDAAGTWHDLNANMVMCSANRTAVVSPFNDIWVLGTYGTSIRKGLGDTSQSQLNPGSIIYDILV